MDFQVGDKVKYIGNYFPSIRGEVGVVIEVFPIPEHHPREGYAGIEVKFGESTRRCYPESLSPVASGLFSIDELFG